MTRRFFCKWLFVLFPALLFICGRVFIPRLVAQCLKAFQPDAAAGYETAAFLTLLICLVAALYGYIRECRNELKQPVCIGEAAVIRCLCVGIGMGMIAVLSAKLFGSESEIKIDVIWILTRCILGPITEEIVFRGLVYDRGSRYWGENNALIISSLVFAGAHQGLFPMLEAFAAGFALGWLRKKEGSILSPIYAHILMNTTVFAALAVSATV